MSKRIADKQLTDRNWDDEDEPEEAGIFKQAATDVIKKREIKVAKRKQPSSGDGTTAFKGFSGFTGLSAKPTTTAAPSFNFGLGTSKGLSGLSNGSSTSKPAATSGFSFGSGGKGILKNSPLPAPSLNAAKVPLTNGSDKTETQDNPRYLAKLKSLNEAVSKWIKDHVDQNAYCILTPIFRDYEKHLKDIEKLNTKLGHNEGQTEGQTDLLKKEKATVDFKFTSASSSSESQECSSHNTSSSENSARSSETTTTSTDSSSKERESSDSTPVSASSSSAKLSSSTASEALSTSTFPAFAFKPNPATMGFSFASSAPKPVDNSSSQGQTSAAGDDDYVPPKVEVNQVTEEDAFYSKRCKLFYQKEGSWKERGVGNLHLKPCGDKTQLIIRADTNLGNILLNIMLSSSIPFKRQGKNNVSLICMPNPPIDKQSDKPVSMLIRVKTGEDADALLEKLNEHKS